MTSLKSDLLVKGGTLVTAEFGAARCDVAVKDGKVVGLLSPGSNHEADAVIDATGLLLLPGVVDPHLHIGIAAGDPEWRSETTAAAQGGVTTAFTFLMSGDSYREQINNAVRIATSTSYVDFGLHLVPCTREQLDEMDEYVEAGITSFKYFTSFRGDEGAYLGITGTDDGYMFDYLHRVAAVRGGLACVHAENIEVVWRLREKLIGEGKDGLSAWNQARPPAVEADCVHRAMLYAREAGCPLYLVHISSRLALDEVRTWRARFPESRVLVETCPHFLTHTYDMPEGSVGKANPPLRSEEDVEALWRGLADGSVDTIGSDHVARPRAMKDKSIWEASAGFPGTGAILPILLSEGHHKRGLTLRRIVELTAANPAKALSCYPRKGTLGPGSDADIVLVDIQKSQVASPDVFGGIADYSLWDGWSLKGWPVRTLLRGRTIALEGAVVGEPGSAQYIRRSPETDEDHP